MSMSAIKRDTRQAIHAEMGEPCRVMTATGFAPTPEQSGVGLALSIRFKTKLKVASAESDALSILENVESLIFSKSQLTALALELEGGMEVDVPGYEIIFQLDGQLDGDGPENVYWTVVRA